LALRKPHNGHVIAEDNDSSMRTMGYSIACMTSIIKVRNNNTFASRLGSIKGYGFSSIQIEIFQFAIVCQQMVLKHLT
jgi:hypothetical protein